MATKIKQGAICMEVLLSKEELIYFEEDIAECFNKAMIKAPIHLYNGNEEQMIEIFKKINVEDWVLCSWRSHYQCLLKGVPKEKLKKDILDGHSISLCYNEYRIVSSAIVGGVLPIATGIALDIKNKGKKNKVYCFMGDMTSETGMMYECLKYSVHHKLPIHFVIEDNGKAVCTDTKLVWGIDNLTYKEVFPDYITYYKYDSSKYPHAGSGQRIQF
jgi:pyruvate dehydrogenase E1 component alpha subunit